MPAHFLKSAKIKFEGPSSKNPLAFSGTTTKESEMIEGRSMRDHLRFGVAYWHTFRGTAAIR